ncbi:MAG: hypothetical protein COA57_08105 [Flavobacteriales bacterium]|nr:MAG: hypothetical protein COA57_08105 [Flavobacteriales bacterium]
MKKLFLYCSLLILNYSLSFAQQGKIITTSWAEAKTLKQANIAIFYYDSDNFISKVDGKLQGIEYDLFLEFIKFLEAEYLLKVNAQFIRAESFSMLYEKVKNGKLGYFGMCSFSITENRKREVAFSPKYMPDIEVLICSQNLPLITDTAKFIELFKNATALNVPNTTFEQDLDMLKKYMPEIKIENEELASTIRQRIASEPDLFGYVELPIYLASLKKGVRLKRQQLFKVERFGYAFIFPLISDWNEPVNAFFNSTGFKPEINRIIRKHLGDDVKDLVSDLASEETIFKDKEIALLAKEREIQDLKLTSQELEINQKQMLVYSVSGVLLLLFLLAGVLYRSNVQKQKANDLISEQKMIIEEKNKDITDSISYARTIQDAILPSFQVLEQVFEDFFVLYKPRDIVSGDFYWMGKINQTTIITVADCTGHGVPGAFMSMMGHNYLSQIITDQEITSPGDALATLDEKINRALRGKSEQEQANDGMDIAICAIDREKKWLQFSGARNSLLLLREGEITELKGSKYSIGGQQCGEKEFSDHEVELQKGDCLYMTTDGYPDQFGGEKGKKFKLKKLKELLVSVSAKDMKAQMKILEETFENWRGEIEQIDDVCVVGIRV